MDAAALVTPYNHISFKRRKNTWYTIASGNWSDPNIWMSNSHRRYAYPAAPITLSLPAYPSANDDVFINHNVVVDISVQNASNYIYLNNLFISGNLSFSGSNRGISVVGDMQVSGTLDMTAIGTNIILYGVNNYVNSFIAGTNSTVVYQRTGDQSIMDLSYRHLSVNNIGRKTLTNNLTITGNLTSGYNAAYVSSAATSCILECSTYNLTVNGTTTQAGGIISKTGSGSLLFIGAFSTSAPNLFQGVDLSGNPTVEFRGGLTAQGGTNITWNTGTGTWSATTATQTWTFNSTTFNYSAPVSVVGAIDLSVAGNGIMSLNQPIDHTVSGRTTTNKGTIYFNSTSSLPSFTTGTFDRTSFANTVGYTMGASITLPYTSYSSLLVSNSGTKTSLGNTALSGNLTVNNTVTTGGTYDLGAFNLSVAGTSSINTTGATLKKTGSGSVIFIGQVIMSINNTATIDFSGGNPTVELRGGINVNNTAGTFKTGTSVWTFTTNNQTISGHGNTWDTNAIISGAITVTITQQFNTGAMLIPSINGTTASSKLLIGTGGGAAQVLLYFTSSTLSMSTGIFDYTTNINSLGYAFDGDYTLPYSNYYGLFISGTGIKTASGNMSLGSSLSIALGGNLDMAGFNLSVSGTTTVSSATLSKTSVGSLTFIGLVTLSGSIASLNLTGNPSLEMRGGLTLSVSGTTTFSGVVTATFTTNNQNITASGGYTIPYNLLVSGAITLTSSAAGSGLVVQGTINGNNAASTFDNRGTVNYQATQQPMLTGVLQTNLAANTFIYNAAGNQDVKGGTYRILTLAGSGVKTLQGNTVVVTTYTLTPPATLNLNGFTRS